jgi:predicted ArsR family transcriptional regulator
MVEKSPITKALLDIACSSMLYADEAAQTYGITMPQAQSIISRLLRQGLIYRSADPKRNYRGSSCAGYQATAEGIRVSIRPSE